MFNSSGPLTEIKLMAAWLATAFARRVFPQPGGPHKRMPVGASRPRASVNSGYLTGARMLASSSSRMSDRAPMSSLKLRLDKACLGARSKFSETYLVA